MLQIQEILSSCCQQKVLDKRDIYFLSEDAPAFFSETENLALPATQMMPQMDFGAFQLQNLVNEPGSMQNNLL